MSRFLIRLLAVVIATGGGMRPCEAQDSGRPSANTLEVVKVVEDVEIKLPGGDWVVPEVGQVIGEGGQISTGPDGEVHLLFPDQSVMIIKQMTEVLVNTLLKQGNAFKAQVLLKIGEVSAQVNPKKVVNSDFSVATPVATASVRGTRINRIQFSPARGMVCDLAEGRLLVDGAGGREMISETEDSQVTADEELIGSDELIQNEHAAAIYPGGLTENEVEQIENLNGPSIFVPASGDDPTEAGTEGATLILRFPDE